jgi:hypothetical protein
MMMLMGDDCSFKTGLAALTVTDDVKKQLALGEKFSTDNGVTLTTTADANWIDYDYIKCDKGSGGGMDDLLPLMMMGGMGGAGGAAGGMDPMMMMLMMDGGSSGMSDLLPLMMMGGGMGGGAEGGMNPMMMMMLMDDDDNTKVACDEKFKLPYAFTSASGNAKLDTSTLIRANVVANTILGATSTWQTEYAACLTSATTEGSSSSSSSMDKLLPLMMMGGMGGQAGGMDPMMMMLMLKD